MNVFVPIDHAWSFKFFEFNKALIAQLCDFFTFCDDFYKSAMLYLETQINYNFGMTSSNYNVSIDEAFSICSRYPTLATMITDAYCSLFNDYRVVYTTIDCIVTGVLPIVEPTGILQGIVLTVNSSWPPK